MTRLVDDEDAVGIAVERQPDVEPAGHDAGPQVALVRGLQRIGGMVRERAVELGEHDLELERVESLERGGHDEAAHAVGDVGDDAKRSERRRVDERHHVVDELFEQVALAPRAADDGRRGPAAGEHPVGERPDLGKARIDADRAGTGVAQLDAVVLRRVVRGGEHRRRRVEGSGGEVHEIGRRQPDVDDVDTLLHHPGGEGVDQLRTARTHVATDEHVGRLLDELGETDTEGVRDLRIELVGHRASDVIRLDDLIQY